MSNKGLRMLMCVALAAAVGGIGTSARATVVSAKFDPVTPTLTFAGSVLFNLSDGCSSVATPTFYYVNGFAGSGGSTLAGCTVNMLNATVTLTNSADKSETDTIEFPPDYLDGFAVWGVDLEGSTVLGIDTYFIGPAFGGVKPSSPFFGPWYIEFSDSLDEPSPDRFGLDPSGAITGDIINTVELCRGSIFIVFPIPPSSSCPSLGGTGGGSVAYLADNTYNVVGATVPEPGSLGLLLGALGAGWWMRRRKVAV